MPLKDPEARRQYQKEYAAKHRVRIYEQVKAWRKANPEKRAEQNRRYAKNHPDKIVEKTQRWRRKNPIRAAEICRRTRRKNAGRVLANKAKYRADRAQRTPIWLSRVDLYEMRCIYEYCTALRKIGLDYEVDHVVPLRGANVSGLHVPSNLTVVHRVDNRSKSNTWDALNA